MKTPTANLYELLRTLHPVKNEGVYAFASVPFDFDTRSIETIATIREREGLTVVVTEEEAQKANLRILFRCVWITLTVHSDLQAVGLTAAFSAALGDSGISCNVVAGAFHDHIFVPVDAADRAMETLWELQWRNS